MGNCAVTHNWSEFRPRDYLKEYYSDLGAENLDLLKFMVTAFRDIPSGGVFLDFGGGPTIYPLIVAANKVAEMHFCDYLSSNLNEVQLWLENAPSAYNWFEFFKIIMELEGQLNPTPQSIFARETNVRKKVTRLFKCDAGKKPPIDAPYLYDVIVTNFCLESATNDRHRWRTYLKNLLTLLKPDGFLLLSALKGATSYSVGKKLFPAVSLHEDDLTQALIEEGIAIQSIRTKTIAADRPSRNYKGLICLSCKLQHGTQNP